MRKYILLVLCFLFAACGGYNYSGALPANYGKPKPNTPATMRPYKINGKTYYPSKVNIGDTETGIASWYGPGFHGKKTSNGEIFDTRAQTAAHKTLPMNTMVKVHNLENGKVTIVRINDRGPFVAGRIIDLSNRAAHEIDMTKKGTARVKLTVIGFNANAATEQRNSTNRVNRVINNINSVSGGDFMLQIGAFKSESNAYKFAKKYSDFRGYTSKVLKSSDGLFRVFLKGFKSEAEAKDFMELTNMLGSFISRE